MRRSRAGLAAVTMTAAVGLVLAGCSQQSNQGTSSGNAAQPAVGFPETADLPAVPGKPGGTFRLGITEPTAIDPYNVQESEGSTVNKALFTGLVDAKPNGDVIPGVATKWTPNADCTQWTFDLKTGTTFSNGEPVDAAAFKRGWDRTSAKASASQVSYHLDEIAGYDQMQDGSATTLSGVDATDPKTLKVTLSKADCEFELRTMHPVASPVPTVAGAADNKTYNDMPIGNGPFKMDGPWQHEKGIKLVRNDTYGAGPKANLDAVEITITPSANGNQVETDGFNNGTFDWARMPTPVLTSERAANEPKNQWISKKTAGIDYLMTMDTTKPLDSADARKAISMAIDRNAIAQGVFQGSKAPATSLLPPSFTKAYVEGVCTACKFDPAAAKDLAAKAGLTPGTEVKFQFNTGGGHEEWTAAVKQQLETNLGLKVTYSGVPFKDMLTNQRQPGASGFYRSSWGADYPTPGNFIGPLLATSSIGAATPADVATGDNKGRYSNPQVDALLTKAASTTDEAARNDLYKQAEKISIGDDLGIIPMFIRQQFRLANTAKFGNVKMDFFENPTLAEITLK
ncbi:peptide ABC transporter substrate-binding protein [Pseudonocardia sp. GCM10023141]|uniref:peptide ABC transporter substrate-binding protein n=1 Tax=Pseudonocardia sp. GCM10023141 TaxID=3252653 RepID=UPI00361013F0